MCGFLRLRKEKEPGALKLEIGKLRFVMWGGFAAFFIRKNCEASSNDKS
jgi:hypothetical protein